MVLRTHTACAANNKNSHHWKPRVLVPITVITYVSVVLYNSHIFVYQLQTIRFINIIIPTPWWENILDYIRIIQNNPKPDIEIHRWVPCVCMQDNNETLGVDGKRRHDHKRIPDSRVLLSNHTIADDSKEMTTQKTDNRTLHLPFPVLIEA